MYCELCHVLQNRFTIGDNNNNCKELYNDIKIKNCIHTKS